jgi:hypothetical protein
MMTNIKIELTDDQRAELLLQLTGKKGLVSRAQLNEFVQGAVEGALVSSAAYTSLTYFNARLDLTQIPRLYADKYVGKSDTWKKGWLRGWTMVGESVGK